MMMILEQIQDLQIAFLQVNELSPLSPAENAVSLSHSYIAT